MSQQPQDKVVSDSSCKNVSGAGEKGYRRVRRKKWRKTVTGTDDIPPPCEMPKSGGNEVNIGSKSQDFIVAEITSQDAGLLEKTESLCETNVEPQDPIQMEIGPPQNDVTVIQFGSKDPMQLGSEPPQNGTATSENPMQTSIQNETETGNETLSTASESSNQKQRKEDSGQPITTLI